jgi:ABC-type Zn2+ transport system substrate-binding protein/surface adhesin
MAHISIDKIAQTALGALFGFSTVVVMADYADARGRGGGHGPHMSAHHGGGHHGGGNGGHHGGGSNQHYHHHDDNWHHHYDHNGHYDHYGRWVAGAAVAGATAAVIGTILYSLPADCRQFNSAGVKYWECGSVYYRSQYVGSDVTYVVVNRP